MIYNDWCELPKWRSHRGNIYISYREEGPSLDFKTSSDLGPRRFFDFFFDFFIFFFLNFFIYYFLVCFLDFVFFA